MRELVAQDIFVGWIVVEANFLPELVESAILEYALETRDCKASCFVHLLHLRTVQLLICLGSMLGIRVGHVEGSRPARVRRRLLVAECALWSNHGLESGL